MIGIRYPEFLIAESERYIAEQKLIGQTRDVSKHEVQVLSSYSREANKRDKVDKRG